MRGCLRKEESMSEENKAVIRRLYEEVWNQHNPEAADECCVDVHRDVHLIVEVVGPPGTRVSRRSGRWYRGAVFARL